MADKEVKEVKEEAPKVQPEDVMPDIPQAAASEPVEIPAEGKTPDIQTSDQPQTNEAQPAQQPAATPVPAQAAPEQVPEKTPQQDAQERLQHDMQFADDLKFGAVHPKTYQDLYADKSLPGKVGTIFGLLLAGAGSGVNGQPNALMEMMNKQIERDFEAQKANQQNKQSWYHYSLQHELQQPEVAKKWSEAQKAGYINQQMGITDNSASASGVNRQTAGVLNDLQHNINMLPPGPNKDAAQAQFNNVTVPFFMQKAAERQQNAASKNAVIQATIPKPKQVAKTPSAQDFINNTVNTNEYQNRLKRGRATVLGGGVIDPKTMIDPSDDKPLQDAITHSKVNRANYKDVMDAAQALAEMPNAGEAPIGRAEDALKKVPWVGPLLAAGMHFGQGKLERPRDQLLNALGQRLSARGASGDTIQEIKEALAPSMFDSPETMKKLEELNYQHFAHNDAEQNGIFDKYQGIKNPLPRIKLKVNAKKEGEAEKAVGKTGDILNKTAKEMGMMP